MRILICDDDEDFAVRLKNDIEEYMRSAGVDARIDTVFSSEDSLCASEKYDLAFLDIELGGVNGLALARALKERSERIILFFVTAFGRYHDDAMDVRAFRFFEKPIDPERLRAGLDRAMEYLDETQIDVYVTGTGRSDRIAANDILYINRANRRVLVKTKTGALFSTEPFEAICEKLPQMYFYLIHRSFLINLHYVETYSYDEVRMDDGAILSVASRRQTDFRRRWIEYLRRR